MTQHNSSESDTEASRLLAQAPFLPKAGGGGAPGAPKFFIPGGGGGAASGATEAPAAAAPWGFSGAGNTQPPTPRSGHTTPVAQSPVSKPRSPQSEPPLARPRGFQPSEDTGNEQLSWQQWRQQDEVNPPDMNVDVDHAIDDQDIRL